MSQSTLDVSWTYGNQQLFRIAHTAVSRSRDSPEDALVAILFAVATIECFMFDVENVLNLPSEFAGEPRPLEALRLVLVDLEEAKAPVQSKIGIYLHMISGQRIDQGKQPFQDLRLLIRLRNFLVHQRPEEITSIRGQVIRDKPIGKMLNELFKRKLIADDDLGDRLRWSTMIATPEVAEWACDTVMQVIGSIRTATPESLAVTRAIRVLCESVLSDFTKGRTKAPV